MKNYQYTTHKKQKETIPTKRGTPSEVYRGKDLHITKSNGERFPLSWKFLKR